MTQALTNKSGKGMGLSGGGGGGAGGLLRTYQTTCYHVGDDGDYEKGANQSYTILTTGTFSGTTAVDTPHYAANGLTFAAADDSITDAAAGLVTFLDNDTIRVRGSTSNDGVYTIAAGTGATAGHFHVNEALADEAAGAYVTICKRTTPSNNAVTDNVTGLTWKRYPTNNTLAVEKVGETSNGLLCVYDTATCYTLHPAAADLQMMTTGIKIVGGAAELPRYFAGMLIDCNAFAQAVNNLPGHRVTSVAVNGADLDILLWTGRNTLIAEAAGGARDIRVVCRSIFAYCAAANAASYAGYTDWRVCNINELFSLHDWEVATSAPNAVAFPNWPASYIWSSTTVPNATNSGVRDDFSAAYLYAVLKSADTQGCELVRG